MWVVKKKVTPTAFQAALMNCGLGGAIKAAKANQPRTMWYRKEGNESIPQTLHRAAHDEEQKTTHHKKQIPPRGNET